MFLLLKPTVIHYLNSTQSVLRNLCTLNIKVFPFFTMGSFLKILLLKFCGTRTKLNLVAKKLHNLFGGSAVFNIAHFV